MAEHNYYIADEVKREMACLPQCFVILQYIDGHFDLVLATDRVYSLLGISKEMLRERYRNHFWQFFHPDDMPALRSKLREIFGHLDTVYPFGYGSKSGKATGGCAAICRDGVWKTEPCSSMPP